VIGAALIGTALVVASAPRAARVVIMLCAAAGVVGMYLFSPFSEAGVELYLMWGAVAAVLVLAALLVPSRAR